VVLTDLVVSCRVLGRGVEQHLLHVAGRIAHELGASRGRAVAGLRATFLPTSRNSPCRTLLDDSGAERDGDTYRWSLSGGTVGPDAQPHVRTIGMS
jgi:predicted enzyme involved in methoxymalonyl-ACP biosynthesis